MLALTKLSTIFVLYFVLVSSLFASSLTDLKTHLSFNNLSSLFHQETYDSKQHLIQDADGEMLLKRPGLFRWQVNKPYQQVLVVNPEGVWNKDTDLEQVTLYDSDQSMKTSPAALLIGDFASFEQNYLVEKVPVSDNQIRYILSPKTDEAGQWFEWVSIEFYQDKLKKMTIADHLGQNTVIHFSKVRLNQGMALGLFKIKITDDIDFIDQRQSKPL